MPSISADERRAIVARVSRHPIRIRTLPPIADLLTGKYLLNQIQEIDIDEVLGRLSLPPDGELLADRVRGRSLLVTGAGGSIGSELCRLIARSSPKVLGKRCSAATWAQGRGN
jgi:FlaA1/EpsC-like NDP-sugar epimerase